MAQMAEEDEYADVLGVINALERTCELESKLRQAIASTHPLQTTLDWDFQAADKEREALLAISEQLEYLEDKLREYRNMESRDADNKAVVLSQLDGVRRELMEVTRNCAMHITFGKEVVREVLAFANVGGEDEQEDGSLQSPPSRGPSGSRGGYRGPGGLGSRQDGYGQQQQQQRTYTALMSPSQRALAAGFSPSTNVTRSVDPSRASSPYSTQQGQPQQAQQGAGTYYGGGERGASGGWRSGGRASADERPGPRPVSAPRRQINLDVAAASGGGGAAVERGGGSGRGGGSALGSARSGGSLYASKQYDKYEAYGYGASAGLQQRSEGGGGSRILSRLDPPPQRARSPSPASLRAEDIYGAVNGAGSQPRSAPPATGRQQQGEEYGGMVRIRDLLNRAEQDLTQVQAEKEQRRSPQPPRIFGEDLNSRFKSARDGGSTPASSAAAAAGGQRQLPSPARSRSAAGGARILDTVPAPSARPAHSSGSGGGLWERGGGGSGGEDSLSLSRHRAAVRDAKEAEQQTPRRVYHARPKIVDPRDQVQGPTSSHTTGRGRRPASSGSAGKAVVFLGGLVVRVVGIAAVGAAAVLGAQAMGAAASWGRDHLRRGVSSRRPAKPPAGRDIPPWLLASPAPPPGSPQRSSGGGNGAKRKRPVAPRTSSGRDLPPWQQQQQGGKNGGGRGGGGKGLPLLPQSPVTHVLPLPEGDLFPSMPAPDVNMAKG